MSLLTYQTVLSTSVISTAPESIEFQKLDLPWGGGKCKLSIVYVYLSENCVIYFCI